MKSSDLAGVFMVLMASSGCSHGNKEVDAPAIPAWIGQSTPVKAGSIPPSDYPYLADWLNRNGKPAQDYVFDLFESPFANILSPAGWDAPEMPLARIARGYVYLCSRGDLHKNTPIPGFVTEQMFKKYKEYYETDFGRTFANAKEVDEYLQKHRFPHPTR